jgi:hypothetical protein
VAKLEAKQREARKLAEWKADRGPRARKALFWIFVAISVTVIWQLGFNILRGL